MKLNELFSDIPRLKGKKILGRGIGCGKGKTSGRGHKGQKARSGCSIKGFEGGQQSILTRLPKRGFRSMSCAKYEILNLKVIQRLIDAGKIGDVSNVSKDVLVECGVLSSTKSKVKVLGDGELKVKVGLHYDAVSKSASDKVFLPEC